MLRTPRSTLLFLAVLALGLAVVPGPSARAEDHDPSWPNQLIVRLSPADSPESPTPEGLAADVRQQRTVTGGLGLGGPVAAEPGLARRASARLRAELAREPDDPRARLERYVVLTYPPVVDIRIVAEALSRNPHVEAVGVNEAAELSLVPNDPLMIVSGSASTHQWGPYAVALDDAWAYTKGHGYLGIVDTGIDTQHPDHLGQYWTGSSWAWGGGNYRPHLSWDYGQNDSNPDEGQAQGGLTVSAAGHGTHVAGIAAAHAGNSTGVAGTCWNCSLMIGKVSQLRSDGANVRTLVDDVAEGITGMVDNGAQVINLSLGYRSVDCAGAHSMLCDAVAYADRRDVVVSAAAGNDGTTLSDYPATDPTVLGVGGIEISGAFWDDCATQSFECGSNSDSDQFVMPAKEVLSTFYRGISYSPTGNCDDSLLPAYPGYGPCTGTSMSAPAMTGLVGLLRSINPLVDKQQIRGLLLANLDNPGGWNPAHGHGKPDALGAVEDALGRVGGAVLPNRLTPLFRLYSYPAEDTMLTTVPQWGSVGYWGSLTDYYVNQGRGVPYYSEFPDTRCRVGPCSPGPGADVYVFSTDRSPNGHPLVPLYRLSYEGGTVTNPNNRDHVYTTEEPGILAYASVGYRVDGVEGYIYKRCTPEPSCMPLGTVRLYRYYNPTLDDHALFPETDLPTWTSQGYGPESGANEWIGYVYLNQDSDFDYAIDGFELLMGTDPQVADSDCDGTWDGQEIVLFPYTDPLDGTCSSSRIIGEVGQVTTLNHQVQTVVFGRTYDTPVVFAQPPSRNGGQQAVVRITNVGPTSFSFQLVEPPDLDGTHTTESVSWVALEEGSWTLSNGAELEVGTVVTDRTVGRNVSDAWETVGFGKPFVAAPVAFSQIQTNSDTSFVKTRQLAASTTSFRTAMEEEEASTTFHGTETVGWMALSPGSGTWSGKTYQVALSGNVVTHAFTTLPFSAGFGSPPRFLASMASRNGIDGAGLRYTALTASTVQVKVEEDTTFDPEVNHVSEVVGFLAIEGNGPLEASPR